MSKRKPVPTWEWKRNQALILVIKNGLKTYGFKNLNSLANSPAVYASDVIVSLQDGAPEKIAALVDRWIIKPELERVIKPFTLAGVTIVRDKEGRIEGVRHPSLEEDRPFVIHKFEPEQLKEVNP